MASDVPPVYIEFKANIQGIQQSLKTIEGDLKKFETKTKETGNATKEMSAKTIAAGAVMASVFQKVAGSVIKFGTDFVSTYQTIGQEVRGLQRVVGGTAEDMSRLRFAAEEVGVSTDDLTVGVRILAKHLTANDAAAKGLGITYRDSSGNILPFTDIMAKISDKFTSMPNGIEKTALAVRTFGRSATTLLPLLNQGSKGLQDLYANADKLGLTMSGKDLEAVKDYTMKQREMHAAVQGLQLAVGRDLVPQLSKLATFVMNNVVPQLQSFVNGLLGNKGLVGAAGKAGEAAHTWGTRLRGTIGIIISMKKEIAALGGILLGIFVVKKIYNGMMAILGVVKLLRAAYLLAATATKLLAVAEGESSAPGIVKAITFVTTAVQGLFMGTEAATAATTEMTAAAAGAAAAEGVEAAAMDGLAASATAAAVAEDAVIVGEEVVSGGGFSAAAAAGLVAAGVAITGIVALVAKATSAYNDATKTTPKVLKPGDPGFVGPMSPADYAKAHPEIAAAAATATATGGTGASGQTLRQSLADQVLQAKAIKRLKRMGASQGLIDALISSSDWKKEYGKVIAGGQTTLRSLQNLFNQTETGRQEVFLQQHKTQLDKIKQTAISGYRKFDVALSKEATQAGKVSLAKSYLKNLNPLIRAAELEEKKTRNTDLHAQAVATLNKVLGEQAKAQKEINKLTGEATTALNDQAQAQNAVLQSQQNQTSWLAAHSINQGQTNSGTITVPVVIDGHEVFRVVQKYANQNNRRNITTGIGLSGAII